MKKEKIFEEPKSLFFNMYALKCLLEFSVENNLTINHYIIYDNSTNAFVATFMGMHEGEGQPVWARQFNLPEDKLVKAVKLAYKMLGVYELKHNAGRLH